MQLSSLSAFAVHQFVEPAVDIPVWSRTAQMRKPVQAVFTRGISSCVQRSVKQPSLFNDVTRRRFFFLQDALVD